MLVSPIVLEAGVIIKNRWHVGIAGGFPPIYVHAWGGYDVLRFAADRAALTVWLGAGYTHLNVLGQVNGTQLLGALASTRVSLEYRWGHFLVRPELFARLQFVGKWDEENDAEGSYRTFTPFAPAVQVGATLSVGAVW